LKTILVLYAQDSQKQAERFIENLTKRGFEVNTLIDLKLPIVSDLSTQALLSRAVNIHDLVIVLVSDGLFANCNFKSPILQAIKLGKCISAAPKNSNVIMPTWFVVGFKSQK